MRGLAVSPNKEHYQLTKGIQTHDILVKVEKPLTNYYHTDIYVLYGTITLLDKRRLSQAASSHHFNSPVSSLSTCMVE